MRGDTISNPLNRIKAAGLCGEAPSRLLDIEMLPGKIVDRSACGNVGSQHTCLAREPGAMDLAPEVKYICKWGTGAGHTQLTEADGRYQSIPALVSQSRRKMLLWSQPSPLSRQKEDFDDFGKH